MVAHGVGDAPGLHHQVQPVDAARRKPLRVEFRQKVEQDQRRYSLPVRGNFEQLASAIAGCDRRDPVDRDRRQIVLREHATLVLHDASNLRGDLALVECLCAIRRDPAQRLPERGKAHAVTRLRHRAVEEVVPRPALVGGQLGAEAPPVARHARMHGEAVLGIGDGIREKPVEAPAREALGKRVPGRDRTGNSYRMRPRLRHRDMAVGAQPLGAGQCRRPARAVQSVNCAVRFGEDHEAVTADTRHVRFDHRENGRGRDRGVNGIAALAQHVERRRRRQRMRRRGHPVLGDDR